MVVLLYSTVQHDAGERHRHHADIVAVHAIATHAVKHDKPTATRKTIPRGA
jgi:hypothetical protein